MMMKLFLAIGACLFPLMLSAQSYPSPDFVEKPMYYNLITKELVSLERQIRPYREDASGFSQTFFYHDAHSSCRIRKSDGVQFLMKLVNSIEPDLFLYLYQLTSNSDNRTVKVRPLSKDFMNGTLPFTYQKVADNLYMFTVNDLPPGEYVWYLKSASYLFAVE